MVRLIALAFAAVLLFSIFGCAGSSQTASAQPKAAAQQQGAISCSSFSVEACPATCAVCPPCESCSSITCQSEAFCRIIGFDRSQYESVKPKGLSADATGNTAANAGGAGAQTSAGGDAALQFGEWTAPDGSITLLVPEGWKASEGQIDSCTVNWAALDSAESSKAFMNNQIMVLKSEDARQMYQSYGLAGVESSPVAGYLQPEQALSQVAAPLSGATNVQVASRDAALGEQLANALCMAGFSACNASAFDATFDYNGVKMHGRYFMQTYDFGEGTTWWINLWGYEAPEADWARASPIAGKILASAAYTDAWVSKCGKSSGAAGVVDEVVKSRQAASDKAVEAWDKYIRGE